MSPLFTIPLEIRHGIFHWVMCSLSEPPTSPDSEQQNRQRLPYGEYLSRGTWNDGDFLSRGVWYRRTANPALPLLLVNKRMNEEVARFLQYVPEAYHVDIMYVKESGLWPTWSMPVLPRTGYIGSVHANIRMFDPPNTLENRFWYRMRYMLDFGSMPSVDASFYGLLSALFKRGPGLLDRSHPEDDDSVAPKYVVKDIIVNIIPPTDGASHESILLSPESYGRRARRGLRRYPGHDDSSVPPEERMASHLSDILKLLLDFRMFSLNIGMIVYEQMIGSFIFMIDGKECERVEVDERLKQWEEHFLSPYDEKIISPFGRWKSWVDGRRQRMKEGLELDNIRPIPRLENR